MILGSPLYGQVYGNQRPGSNAGVGAMPLPRLPAVKEHPLYRWNLDFLPVSCDTKVVDDVNH
ncbi:MAG: hypothetical protein LBQ89_01915 [Treponema sp.]|nr:hypothetical protein [Treponema sp.]